MVLIQLDFDSVEIVDGVHSRVWDACGCDGGLLERDYEHEGPAGRGSAGSRLRQKPLLRSHEATFSNLSHKSGAK